MVAFCPAAAAAAGEGVGVVEEEEVRVGEAAAAVARGEGDDAVVAAAVAGGEVAGEAGAGLGEGAAAANATGKEGSLAEMIDRALEKEFPESEGEQGGGGALDLVTSGGGGGWVPRDPPGDLVTPTRRLRVGGVEISASVAAAVGDFGIIWDCHFVLTCFGGSGVLQRRTPAASTTRWLRSR